MAYALYITGARGWVPWASAQGVPSSGLSADTATRVAEYYYYRTHGFTLWLQLGGQVTAAIAHHFTATTDCGTGRWAVLSRDGEAFTSGHPAPSSAIDDIKKAHQKALARDGHTGSDSVEVLEPVHVRAFFRAHLSGRALRECDPCEVMLHAAVLMGMSLIDGLTRPPRSALTT